MHGFLSYPYLVSLIPTALFALLLCVRHPRKKTILTSGLLLSVFSPIAYLHEHEYWNPQRLGGLPVGIEDLLFCFSIGSIIWYFTGTLLKADSSGCSIRWKPFLAICTGGGIVFLLLGAHDQGIMTATVVSQTIVASGLLVIRPWLWKPVFAATAGFSLYYCGLLYIFSLILPGFWSMWNGWGVWGVTLWGMPIEEVLWAASFSASWSLVMAYTFGVHSPEKI